MATTKEAFQNIFFGGTRINGLEALGPQKYIDLLQAPERKVEVLKRPVVLALSAVKTGEALASLAFVVKAGVLAFGPTIYAYMGANPGEVDQSQIGITMFYAAEHAFASLGSHFVQTKLQGD